MFSSFYFFTMRLMTGCFLFPVTQLMGGEVVKFAKTSYHLHLSEATPLGGLVTIEAHALHTGESVMNYQ